MKAFSFRLDQALRWRSAQLDLEKASLATAVTLLTRSRQDLAESRTELSTAAKDLTMHASDGAMLASWPAWEQRMHRRIQQLQAAERQAEAAVLAQTGKLAEANRKLQLLENLKANRKLKWTADFAQELETFAAESFLGRLQSKRTGA